MPNTKPLTLALLVALTIGMTAQDADAQRKRKAAAPKGPPPVTACSDFHAFTNKDWLLAHPAPATGSTSVLADLQLRAEQQQRDLLDSAMTQPRGNVQKLLGDFWASGLDEAAVEADGAQPIAPLLDRINGIKRAKDIPPSIAALHQVGIPVAFNFSADVDLTQLDRHIGYLAQGGLGLPDPAYYTRTDADTRALLGRYVEYVRKILILTGTPADQAAAEAQQVIDLETRIAQSSKPIATLRDPRLNYAAVPTADVAKTYKRLQLAEFLKVQGVSDDTVSVANPALFAQLDTLVGTLKPAQWKTYLRFHVGNAMAPYLSKPFRDADFEFRGRVLRGELAQPGVQPRVLAAINKAAGPMMAREYVGRYLPDATRARAQQIAGDVRDALARAVDANTWMGDAARAEAKAKVAKLSIEVGAPRRDLDYTVQPTGRGSFGSNMLIASTWHHREEMKRIGRGNADRRWDVLPQQPSLMYDIAQNRLIVSAAVLQPPVLDMAQSAPHHYGTFGALVGHELGRSIDSRGRNIDAAGALRNWWTVQEDAAWLDRGSRLAAQYGGYAYPGLTAQKVDGARTRDENMADLGGVELAWSALQVAQPALAADGRQAFYRGWAQLWQEQPSVVDATRNAASGTYAPGKWRANGPLANQPGFATAFTCKDGDAMVRKAADQISIWR